MFSNEEKLERHYTKKIAEIAQAYDRFVLSICNDVLKAKTVDDFIYLRENAALLKESILDNPTADIYLSSMKNSLKRYTN